ncbi:Alcohol oxidase [Mycena chlorophos]|uniref:Alcohol oxidase n=1 Tax=Mycena chlorophos TaxID=658473 RepID=A0A8H6SSY7_MYCCL|nr:Alcohol oxidase [Mycena chlorophos]
MRLSTSRGSARVIQRQGHSQRLHRDGLLQVHLTMNFGRTRILSSPVEVAGSVYGTPSPKIYDYIVVGGGTAGCCLASRLSEDPDVSVLLLERGPVYDSFAARVPLLSNDQSNPQTPIVKSPSLPVHNARGQTLSFVQGECLGGGSSINGLIYTRGWAGDFDNWAKLGHPSWDYKSMEPYFIKSENALSHRSQWRGSSGPMVNQLSYIPFSSHVRIQQSAVAMGFTQVSDLNSPNAPVDASAVLDTTIDTNSHRVSSFTAYLPAKLVHSRKSRLTICPLALATRVQIEDGVAVGVVFESADGRVGGQFYARCRNEIVLCGGAIASPQLLLLSGIGPQDHLQSLKIPVVVDLPGVGAHLQDHVGVPLMFEVPIADTLHHTATSTWKGVLEFFKYILGFKSVFASNPCPVSIFAHSSHLDKETSHVVASEHSDRQERRSASEDDDSRPDIEIMTIPFYAFVDHMPPVNPNGLSAFSFLVALLQPKSTGSVRLASADPRARPAVDLGYLSDPRGRDIEVLRKGTLLALQLAAKTSASGYPMKHYQVPESESEGHADAHVDEFIRTKLGSAYHFSSTCRMGSRASGSGGVVDDELRVYGVEGLRVCDASVFPSILSAHLMAGVIAVAEKCADLIQSAHP